MYIACFFVNLSTIPMDQNSIPKLIDTPIIKINICSRLIATGHGIAPKVSSFDMNTKQWNQRVFYGDISLSKTCRKR
jgi:hypothetical protein